MSTLLIGATSVLRTLVVVAVGSFTATLLNHGGSTNSWFSALNVYIFLPCLLFGHFATGFSLQVFYEGIPLVIFGFCRIFIGVVTTKLASFFGLFDDETQPLALLATSSSNAVAIPLAILGELVYRVDFLSLDSRYDVKDVASGKMVPARKYVETLMFVYAIPINFSIWSFGQFFIRDAVERKREKELLLEQHEQQHREQQRGEVRKLSFDESVPAANNGNANKDGVVLSASPTTASSSSSSPPSSLSFSSSTCFANRCLPRSTISVGHDLAAASDERRAVAQDENSASPSVSPQLVDGEAFGASPRAVIVSSPQQSAQEQMHPHHHHHNEQDNGESTLKHIFRVYILRSLSVPLVCSFSGIAVSLIPGVQDGITGGWPLITSLSNAVVLLGSAAVPSALLTVGITVYRTLTAASRTKGEEKETNGNSSDETRNDKQQRVEDDGNSNANANCGDDGDDGASSKSSVLSQISARLTKFFGIQASLVVTTSVVQLIVTPLVAYVVIAKIIFRHDFDLIKNASANGIFNSDDPVSNEYWRKRRLMFFALLCESMCPSAMNTAIICTLYKYRSEDFSRMIVYQYIFCVFTMSLLMSLYLSALQ